MSKWQVHQILWMLSKSIKELICIPEMLLVLIISVISSCIIRNSKKLKNNSITDGLFTMYIYLLLKATLFSRPMGMYDHCFSVELYFIKDSWYNILQTIQNLALFVPYAIFLYIYKMKPIHIFISGCIWSFSIELIQYVSGCGTFQISDLILNISGIIFTILGCAILLKLKTYIHKSKTSQNNL